MGRRKIEIKAIKDDRNRSVTFLKRKGGLFKKAHELSVLCSVDVAVFIFGANKKLYEYSSSDMNDMIRRYSFHGGPNEHKGPSDFNGGADDEEEDEETGTPPQGDGMESQMLPPHFQTPSLFNQMRHHTASASPPIPSGVFGPHPGNGPRGHTPQPQMVSRPSSRNDMRRVVPTMVGQPVGPPGPQQPAVSGYAFMPQPAIYNPQNSHPQSMPPGIPHGLPQTHHQFPYPQQHPHPHPHPHPQQMQSYVEEQRRLSGPPSFPSQPQGPPPAPRHSVSPPQPPAAQLPSQLPPQPTPHMSPPPPQPQPHPMQSPPQPQQRLPLPPPPQPHTQQQPQETSHPMPPPQEPQAPAPVEPKPKPEPVERPRQSLLLDTNVRNQGPRKGGSIFTPVDDARSILSQHLAAFHPELKSETPSSRSQSIDIGSVSRSSNPGSPPAAAPGPLRANPQMQPQIKRNGSLESIPETVFKPPSRSNSMRVGGSSLRPELRLQIPDESDGTSPTNASTSPRGTTATDITSQPSRRATDSHASGVVLPPPSPSASALLSAGATGPPNPFARPPPHQNNSNMNIDTPVSALPSRFLTNDYLPSPSSFYPEWNIRSNDSTTLQSPLNFSTPVVGTGPSFLRDEPPQLLKRKSPDLHSNGSHHEPVEVGADAKRVKVDS